MKAFKLFLLFLISIFSGKCYSSNINLEENLEPCTVEKTSYIRESKVYDSKEDVFYKRSFTEHQNARSTAIDTSTDSWLNSRQLKNFMNTNIFSQDYHYTCFLEITYTYKSEVHTYYSSGFLIAPNIVVTAAHLLYRNGVYADRIDCSAARYYDENLGHVVIYPKDNAKNIFITPEYFSSLVNNEASEASKSYDVGLILLPDDAAQKFKKISVPRILINLFDALKDKLNKVTFHTIGYPGCPIPYSACGRIQPTDFKNIFMHDSDTVIGLCGSPLLFKNKSVIIFVGIHLSQSRDGTKNIGVLFNDEMIEKIKELRSIN